MKNSYEEMYHTLQKDYFELNSAYETLDLQCDIILGLSIGSFLVNVILIVLINIM